MIRSEVLRNTPYILQFIFEGQVYNCYYRSTLAASGGADNVNIQFKTNGNKLTHLIGIELHTNSDRMDIDLIENPTLTDGTTPIPTYNYDRRWGDNSGNNKPSDAVLFSDPTNISGGTITNSDTSYGVGSPAGFKSASSTSLSFIEQPLLADTNYIIRLTNFDTVSINYIVRILFYESGN